MKKKKKRVCFVCDTPLQLLNCINIVSNHYASDEYRKDLYLGHIFRDSEKVSASLKSRKLFDHVYDFDGMSQLKDNVFLRIQGLLCPRHILRTFNRNKEYTMYRYDILFISCIGYFTRTAIWGLHYTKIYVLEDGIGEYVEDTFGTQQYPPLVGFVDKLLYRGKLSFVPERIFLNTPEIYSNYFHTHIEPLKRLDDRNQALGDILEVFHYKENAQYKNRKIIYLSQLMDEGKPDRVYDIEDTMLNAIAGSFPDHYMVRIHPRQSIENYKKYVVDRVNNLWELECAYQLTDEHVLIQTFSTAAFEPGFLFGKRPYLIFLINIWDRELREEVKQKERQLIEKTKKLYGTDSNKIFLPNSIEEMMNLLHGLDR